MSLCWLEEVGDAGIAVAELPGVEEEADGGDGLGLFRIDSLRVGVEDVDADLLVVVGA